jgi:hypothetical protein
MQKLFFIAAISLLLGSCKKNDIPDQATNVPATGALQYMWVEENLFGGYLHLYGSFGDSSVNSKVRVGNTLITGKVSDNGTILQWEPWHIKVSIGDPDDDNGAGYVSVINKGVETNKRMLNVWELDMLYKEPDEGTLLKEVRFKAYIRADIAPTQSPVASSTQSTFAAVSQAFWAIGGQGHASYSGGGMTISLDSRSGMLIWSKPFVDATQNDANFQSEFKFQNKAFLLSDLKVHKKKATKYSYLADGSPQPYITDYNFGIDAIPTNQTVKLELDNNNAIKAGSFVTGPHGTQYDFTWNASEAVNHKFNYTLQWNKATARFQQ